MSCSKSPQLRLPVWTPPGAPTTRADCVDGPRPCKWVSCRYHLWSTEGTERPGRRWTEIDPNRYGRVCQHTHVTCSLDVADIAPDGLGRKKVAALLGVTPERVGQIEARAMRRMKMALQEAAHRDGTCGGDCVWCRSERGEVDATDMDLSRYL